MSSTTYKSSRVGITTLTSLSFHVCKVSYFPMAMDVNRSDIQGTSILDTV